MSDKLADQLGELLRLVDGSDVEQLEVEHDGVRFLVRRELTTEAAPVVQPAPARPAPEARPRADSFVITAPVVGVFRRSAGGKGEVILDAGDAVSAGQVVGAVEAMGMLNRVQSERSGVVQEVMVREGQPVEYGQPLLLVRQP
ncbi:MAG: acetyl-CoA carboxylase, biotin carboxyl carrier protein [Chloroflexi bacterium]|nr:acetyl-CoA carboxylase, biotin carboxyl carrier protein [Chloroflexota bacterium]